MEIVIDGYNVIGSVHGLGKALEHQRSWLLQRLAMYDEIRAHRITVVFDGWQSGSIKEEAESRGGIRVVFSKQGEKADAVVIRLARSVGSGCVVVSSDREVRQAVEKIGVVAIYAEEFTEILRNCESGYNSNPRDLQQ